jgi:Carboxypeptidase regulatory-like domain
MRALRAVALGMLSLAVAATARPQVPFDVLQVLGSVTNATRPIGNALVIAFNVTDFTATQTFSLNDGSFTLPPLSPGIYKIIAVKQGFAPAITMVTPARRDHKVALRLQNESARHTDANQEMWEIRASLPADVLRQLNMVLDPAITVEPTRLRGAMSSMTGVADQTTSQAFAQTALEVRSQLPHGWQLGFNGNVHRVDDPDALHSAPAVAESALMSFNLRPSTIDSYRLASTRASWEYHGPEAASAPRQADIRSHNFEWDHDGSRIQVRYLSQDNIFAANNAGSALVEVSGNTELMHGDRSGLGVTLAVTQQNFRAVDNATYRSANLTADANYSFVPSFMVHYGLASRIGMSGTEWSPRTAAEWKVTKNTSLIASGEHKMVSNPVYALPTLIALGESNATLLPRYSYSLGIITSEDAGSRVSAVATVTSADSLMRVMLTNGDGPFWDGFFVRPGDVRRDLRVGYRKDLRHFAVDIGASAGDAGQGNDERIHQTTYVTGDVQSTFHPTGTSLAVSYRQMEEPLLSGPGAPTRIERFNLRMAQSLHLPLDVRVLIGLELARATNSTLLVDALSEDGGSRKYIGGLAVNF